MILSPELIRTLFPFVLFGTPFAVAALVWVVASLNKRRVPKKPRKRQPLRLKDYKNWKALRFLRDHYLVILLPIGLFGIVWGFAIYLHKVPPLLGDTLELITEDIAADNADDVRSYAYAFAAMAGALALLFTIPFQLVRVWMNERNTRASEEGLITDRINKAVEALGAQKEVNRLGRTVSWQKDGETFSRFEWHDKPEDTPEHDADTLAYGDLKPVGLSEPNLEVRIGAIYALERIAQDSERDHIQIMEILCAYIRQNAPASLAQDHPYGPWEPDENWTAGERVEKRKERFGDVSVEGGPVRQWARTLPAPRTDIQTALNVLGRRDRTRIESGKEAAPYRGADRYRLDLRGTCLQSADLAHLSLDHARLENARLEGAVLREAQMEGADLSGARMEGAVLSFARMEGADLSEARMEGADLRRAQMQGANLSEARMEGANLFNAQMEGANLSEARMEGANLFNAQMEGADLRRAQMQGADLRDAQMEGADLRGARMQEADLLWAQMEGADLRRARMEGADLSGARMEGANLGGADLKSANWTVVHIDSCPAQFADLRDAKSLTQSDLSSLIGNAATLLPDDPTLYIPDRWETEPPHWAALVKSFRRFGVSEAELREAFLCAPGQRPQMTGTPWPADQPPPWGDEEPWEWAKKQPSRGEVPRASSVNPS